MLPTATKNTADLRTVHRRAKIASANWRWLISEACERENYSKGPSSTERTSELTRLVERLRDAVIEGMRWRHRSYTMQWIAV
ncbi:hypothetical protein PLICRDRAFT_45064 [Plicaturopsis crispa FD-325 SS-3]|nr:hypothetical protein PLICRDRAFT_45064 [Plicaturopsis crispa FD-325 SS-3]